MFYPANAKPFLEAALNILEKLREPARKSEAVGGLNARRRATLDYLRSMVSDGAGCL
jgi:hypothetical protein